MIFSNSVKEVLGLLLIESFGSTTVRSGLEELILEGRVCGWMVAMIVHNLMDTIDGAGRKVCDITDLLHRYTMLKESKCSCSLCNVNTFVPHDGCVELGKVVWVGRAGSGEVRRYSLITFWRDSE